MYRSNPTSQSTFPSTRTLKVRAFRALRAAASRVGLQVVPKTYYSPIPDLDTLPPGVFDRRSALRGIHFDLDEQVAWIEQNLAGAMREFAPPASLIDNAPTGASARICSTASCAASSRAGSSSSAPATRRCSWPPQPSATGQRASRPSCGRSTRIRASRGPGCPGLTSLEAVRAQDVPLEVFTSLAEGDVLFVDTTHTVKVDSDVNRIVLDVLPALAPGVLVHVHDIFLPYEYPRRWHEESGFHWAEQYLLQAFLAGNQGFEVRAADVRPVPRPARTRWRGWRRHGGRGPRRARSGSARQPIQQRRHLLRNRRAAERSERRWGRPAPAARRSAARPPARWLPRPRAARSRRRGRGARGAARTRSPGS